jgi:two-component system, sensor histidine kinase PdtaS
MNVFDDSDKSFFSFKNILILFSILGICYFLILFLFMNTELSVLFSNVGALIVEFSVFILLFYAAKRSSSLGRRVQIAWYLLAFAILSYFLGDVTWALLEIFLNQAPFPSVADLFYLTFYPIFALAIYFLPRTTLQKSEEIKLIMDVSLIILTVGLILWTFLIIPTINNANDLTGMIITIAYVIGDLILLFALIRLIYVKYEGISRGPLILLGLGIMVQIISDIIYSYQSINNSYISGGLLDYGWIFSYLLIGLAAILQMKTLKYSYSIFNELEKFNARYDLSTYIPILLVLIAYSLLIWANETLLISNFLLVELWGGVIIFLILIRQIYTSHENKRLYLSAKEEIKARKEMEKNLIKSRKHFKDIVDNSPIGIFHTSPEGKFLEVNNALADMLNYNSPEELMNTVNKDSIQLIYVDKEKRSGIIEKALKEENWQFYENEFYRKDGTIMTSELSFRYVMDPDETSGYLEGFIKDITERKKSEDHIKASLKEKEMLLKEIHHRVKNNLQVITSMLDLQKYYVNENETLNVLNESQNRVKSMATIHEMLYQSTNLTHINFSDYIYSLITDLCYVYSLKQDINPVIDVDDIFLNIETAIPCGLIINELVSNSLKYAFPDSTNNIIKVELIENQDELELIVSDNGIGFPEKLDYKDIKTSLGLKLVNLLVEQIDGTIDLDRSQGTKFTINFKELDYKQRF